MISLIGNSSRRAFSKISRRCKNIYHLSIYSEGSIKKEKKLLETREKQIERLKEEEIKAQRNNTLAITKKKDENKNPVQHLLIGTTTDNRISSRSSGNFKKQNSMPKSLKKKDQKLKGG